MRSKQQPRPSYRWLKEENEEGDDTTGNPENKENLQSSSGSPSSVHSTENASSSQHITAAAAAAAAVTSQLLPPTLVAAAAAAAAAVSSTGNQQQKEHQNTLEPLRLSNSPSQTAIATNMLSSVSVASSPSSSPSSSTAASPSPSVDGCTVTTTASSVAHFRTEDTTTVTATNPLLSSSFVSLLQHPSQVPSIPASIQPSLSPSLSPALSSATFEGLRQERHRKERTFLPNSTMQNTSLTSPVLHRSKPVDITTTSIDSSTTPIISNLIGSHENMEHNRSSGISIIPQSLLMQDPSTERELASPRCQSRDSSSGGRCPSDDSNYSGNGSTTAPTPTSPVGITLPATLPPAAAVALLPPQSAAMAAYLNVAAAAAQQNRLLLGNPLAAAAGLVRAAQSPPPLPMSSPIPDDSPVLDFSTKRHRRDSDTDSKSDSDAVNLSKSSDNSPLDLSVSSRKRNADCDVPPSTRKMPRSTEYKPVVSPWTSPITPYFAAAVAAASLSPKNPLPTTVDWNGKNKLVPNDATKALEKMSEMTRLSGPENDLTVRSSNNQSSSVSTGRHSAWQSHWLNKGADAAKDVFKCVWCKQSFPTLATLTTHMKETQHCGVNVPPSGNLPTNAQPSHHHHHHHHQASSSASSNSSSNKSDLNLLIKETMPLPRKLVRGQDVWLGKGAEQTRQILKCMWCGQSFRSLAEMTSHMQQTQHYTNIISQEQIISWKSSEDGKGGGQGGSGTGGSSTNSSSGPNSTVSAVLTCKVCDQAFSSLKDLSNHMVKNAHYKEHIMRSITESGGRRRQTREKRKKSLPVRKLLELERAQHDFKNGDVKPMRDIGSTRITCEKCGDKIETALFVEHIRKCVGGSIPSSPRGMLTANSIIPPDSMGPLTPSSRDGRKSIGDESTSPASHRHISPHTSDLTSPSPKESGNSGSGTEKVSSSPSVLNAIEQLIEKSFDTRSRHGNSGFSSSNHSSAPLGSSILKRLGIDESVDYTKPLIDPQTMNLLKSYQQHHYSKRERSGSESSSVSDRGSSRLDSLTPERKPDISNHITPRQSPDKNLNHQNQSENEEDIKEGIKIKREPEDDEKSGQEKEKHEKLCIKKELYSEDESIKDNENELDLSSKSKRSNPSSSAPSPNQVTQTASSVVTSSTPVASPGSDRSTPKSTTTTMSEKKVPQSSGSLNALSSMFDNLTGIASIGSNSSEPLSSHNSARKTSSHPLAALQKLCDKTENTIPNSRSGSTGSLAPSIPPSGSTASGNILAFSWACNDAIMTSDSIIKCAFCDTPFCSKGAYRHHLSKVHFVKDDVIIDPIAIKSTNASNVGGAGSIGAPGVGGAVGAVASNISSQKQQHPPSQGSSGQSPKGGPSSSSSSSSTSSAAPSSHSGSISSNLAASGNGGGGGGIKSPTSTSASSQQHQTPVSSATNTFEESPHSKFLKYTELAKQLSSKYV